MVFNCETGLSDKFTCCFFFPHIIISNQSSDIQLIVVHDDLTDLIQAIDLSDKIMVLTALIVPSQKIFI